MTRREVLVNIVRAEWVSGFALPPFQLPVRIDDGRALVADLYDHLAKYYRPAAKAEILGLSCDSYRRRTETPVYSFEGLALEALLDDLDARATELVGRLAEESNVAPEREL